MAKTRGGGGGLGLVLLGFVFGVLAAGAAGLVYLKFIGLAIAPASKSTPVSKRLGSPPPVERANQEKTPPFGASEDVFESGAHIYRAQCASCHGTPGHDAALARSMNLAAAQLWKSRSRQSTTAQDPSEIYSKVANGIRLTGMPAYKHVLTETQLWEVGLLLANAGKELPAPVTHILTAP